MQASDFRGLQTAAPLKPYQEIVSLWNSIADFRGLQTAAPLKRDPARGHESEAVHFRGLQTAAPLKLGYRTT